MAAIVLLLFAIALIVGPVVATATEHPIGTLASSISMGSGVALAIISSTLLVITRLYQKTKASESFVRTGMGGMKVIQDGGCIVIPVVHQVVPVSLKSIRLQVNREGADALITKDKLRADILAEFFVRVMPQEDDISAAARSFGEGMKDESTVKALVEDKLTSALRTAAAQKTLEELNTERDEFVKQVTQMVTPDLKHNGLSLEVVTISKLDQTDPKTLRPDNIFDAQGLKTIAEITQKQLTERNRLEREGEQARKQQDVETQKRVLELDQEQAAATATQQAEIAKVQAGKTQEAQQKQIEAARAIELSNVEKAKQIEVAQRQQQQAVETAERAKQAAIAEAEKGRAQAQAKLAEAEAERERQQQAIATVKVQSEAERSKTQQVIMAQADAEKSFVEMQRKADAEAYRLQKEAEGKKAAANAEATAITTKAEAEASAAQKRAEGQQAEQMVPVNVKKAEVEVEQKRVDVLKQELQAREEHGKTAQDFELAKLEVIKRAEIQVAAANATAQLVGHVQATVFGTPEDVSRMTSAWMRGMGVSRTVEGFKAGASDETLAGIGDVLGRFDQVLGAVATRVGVKPDAQPVVSGQANGPDDAMPPDGASRP